MSGRRTRVDFPGLDTVRALGALAVLCTHVAFWTGSYGLDLLGTAWSRLDVGVAIFFVLSGFLLSRPFLERARNGERQERVGAYLLKRALRVLPVYWVVAVAALLIVPANRDLGPGAWLRTLTLSDLYFSHSLPAALTQMWSITTEVAFYLVLPLLMWGWTRFTGRRRSDAKVVVMVLATAAISVLWAVRPPGWIVSHAPFHAQWLPAYLVWFAAGIALAHVHVFRDQPHGGRFDLVTPVLRLGEQPGVCWTAVLALFLVASTPLAGPALLVPTSPGELATKTMLYTLIGALIVLVTAFAPRESGYARAMAHPLGRHLGRISYCVFCVHVLVLHLIVMVTPWRPFIDGHHWTILAVVLASSVALAEVLHRLVEAPVMRWRPRGSAAPAVTASSASEVTLSS